MLKLRRYFDTTGGCDLLFSQTAKHERLTFTGNRTTQPSRRRTRCRETAPECRHGRGNDKRQQILNQLLIGQGAASIRAMNLSSGSHEPAHCISPALLQPGVEPMVSRCRNSDCMTPLEAHNRNTSSAGHVLRFPSGVNVIFPRGKN